jgi:hypothetical protein
MESKINYLINDNEYSQYIFDKKCEDKRKLKEQWILQMSKIANINKCNKGDETNSPPLPDDIDWTGTGHSYIGTFNYNDIFFRIYKEEMNSNNYKWESHCNNIECNKIRYTTNFICCNK